jgi:hypothetical protein
MTLAEIKSAVTAGQPVYWANKGYFVQVDRLGQWFITCGWNNHSIGLTHRDGETLNGKESDFFTEEA